MIRLNIPIQPPSVNHYWQKVGNRVFISQMGRQYKAQFRLFFSYLVKDKVSVPCEVMIVWTPPDKRKRDIDNILKVVLDCLKETVIEDDSLIHTLIVKKLEPNKTQFGTEIFIQPRES